MLKGNDIDVVTNTTYEFLSSKFHMFPTLMSEPKIRKFRIINVFVASRNHWIRFIYYFFTNDKRRKNYCHIQSNGKQEENIWLQMQKKWWRRCDIYQAKWNLIISIYQRKWRVYGFFVIYPRDHLTPCNDMRCNVLYQEEISE